MESVFKVCRQRQGIIGAYCISAQFAGYEQPVTDRTDKQADGNP